MDTFLEFPAEVTPLVASGQLKYSDKFVDGYDNVPRGLLKPLNGSHREKKPIVRNDWAKATESGDAARMGRHPKARRKEPI